MARLRAALVAVFIFGLVHNDPASAVFVVPPTKSHLPINVVVVHVNDKADTDEGIARYPAIENELLLIDPIGRQSESVSASLDLKRRVNLCNLEINFRRHRRLEQMDQLSSNLSYSCSGFTRIDKAEGNTNRFIGIASFSRRPKKAEAINDDLGAMRRDEFCISEINAFASQSGLVRAGSVERVSEITDYSGRERSNGARIENVSAVPEDDIQKVVRGAIVFTILIGLAYLVGRRWV